ncbi:hypothetical protein BDB01DRAFT_787628 [Pilobolus umbonatus]|nr:hypothetical protein BDB01DRAFT_787628 [Pilobolus umbonatus]
MSSQGSVHSSPMMTEQRLRRKEQNRAAQRAFRERKEKYVKELEDKIKAIEADHASQISCLENQNIQLQMTIQNLNIELKHYKEKYDHPVKNEMCSPVSTVTASPHISKLSPISHPIHPPKCGGIECMTDKDGISFCERLGEDVCSNAYNQLLSEPLFNSDGGLNETVISKPVPIITTPLKGNKHKVFNELEECLNQMSFKQVLKNDDRLVSCSELLHQLAEHPLVDTLSREELYEETKKRAKCSAAGPVFDENDIREIIEIIEQRAAQ